MGSSRRARVVLVARAALLLGLSAPGIAGAQSTGAVPGGSSGAATTPAEPAPTAPVIVAPKLVTFVEAKYPEAALRAGRQASVLLKLTVDAQGKVTAVELLEPAGEGFDEAAVAAAQAFVFEPATRDGKPFAVKIPYRYDFKLLEPPPAEEPPPSTGELHGVLYVAGTQQPLAGATVTLTAPDGSRSSWVTNDEGRWSAATLAPGTYRVSLEAEGYQPTTSEELVVAGEAADITYRLVPVSEEFEVVVQGERPPREVTRRTLERREIARVPGTGGDALRSLESLPGVARPPGLAGLLIVRGSAPQDTQTFVDGTGVPLIYHFGGLSSVIPTELLEQIDFYPGNFSSQYGRVNGGIVDVRLRRPNTKCTGPYGKPLATAEEGCFHGLAQVDLIDARLMLEGPLGGGWTFMAAGRRSWVDAWLKPVLEEAGAGVTTAPVYYDFQLVAETAPSRHSRLSLRTFGSRDRLEVLINTPSEREPGISGNITFETGFLTAQALYEAELARSVALRSMLSAGHTQLTFSVSTLNFQLDFYPVEARNEFAFRVARSATLNLGMDMQVAPYDVYVRAPPPPRPGEPSPGPFITRPSIERSTSGTGFRPAWYAEAELTPTRKLRIVPGLRLDYARDSGQTDLSPRLNARYDLVSSSEQGLSEAEAYAAGVRQLRTTLKGGVGLYHQPPQFQETDRVFGTPRLASNRALHYALGVEQELSRHLEVGVEGYYKDYTQLVSAAPGAAGLLAYDNAGVGAAYGLETLLKYKPDARFFGWLAYTLARSVRTDRPGGSEHLFRFDQTHNLTLLGSYRLGQGWEVGARFRVISGNLYTPVLGAPALSALYAADAGAYIPLQAAPYSERLPLFHQLDLRVDKRWQFPSWRLNAYLDVQNAYNTSTVQGFDYTFDYSKKVPRSGLPIIPSIGVRGEF